jgi:hypothetical protein
MIVLAREVFLCKCATDAAGSPTRDDLLRELRFVRGGEQHLPCLDPAHHGPDQLRDLRARLARGEIWMLGLAGERVATYTWLHQRPVCEYAYLPGCSFELPEDFAFGYDAWTAPELRGTGLRRRAFVEELAWLRALGKRWEASFFVAHQLESARRSLARAGVHVVPLWRVALGRARRLEFERLRDAHGVTPRDG